MTYALLSSVYGLGWTDINVMPIAAIQSYIERIPRVLAVWKMVAGEGAVVPYSDKNDRLLEIWAEMAFGAEVTAEVATPGMLKILGIGVEHGH